MNTRGTNTTFVNGLSLLEALAAAKAPSGVTELARSLALTKSNVHRLLRTLENHGYVRNVANSGRYEATLRLWELGIAILDRLDVKRVAISHMEDLARISGETVHLSILDGIEVVYIGKVDSPRPIRAYSKVGGRAPAYCVATGKALLAHAPLAIREQALKHLVRHTSATMTSPTQMRSHLAQIVSAGYALNQGEWREGVCGAGAPIRDATGEVIAAIGISGPVDRLKPRTLRRLASDVVRVAASVSAALGCSAPATTASGVRDH